MIRTIRPKYACRACEAHVVQASARARVMDGGMATTALVAHVVVSKFAWHLPLYRQLQIFSGMASISTVARSAAGRTGRLVG
ncbi:transposase [Mesorhizobium onobrychidis]|uniref:Transposase n=1 Tax=Mesorhizobium onobrychidis TaxID=2775404 RepID=A0ABY5QYR4_9HYPH|nr:transposase [Mesorhizobium onobrychidis]